MDTILSEDFDNDFAWRLSRAETDRRMDNSKIPFFEALRFYEQKNFQQAMRKLEEAIQLYRVGVYYYHYGVCLMDIGDLENAEKAFLKTLHFIDQRNPFYESGRGERPIYTFDNNGAPREKYFAYYNLACIYSLAKRSEKAIDYLFEALYAGYPYINHLYNDPDLVNFLNSASIIKTDIQQVYDRGFENTFAGSAYEYGRASEWDGYYFYSDREVHHKSTRDFDYVRVGTYKVENYHIFVRYHWESGSRGIGYIPGGGVMGAYERYEDYENEIDEFEVINIKEMLSLYESVPLTPARTR